MSFTSLAPEPHMGDVVRRFARFIQWLAFAACLPTLLAWGARWSWFCELFTHYPVYYAAVLLSGSVLLFIGRRWKAAVLVGGLGLYNALLVAPLYVADVTSPVASGADRVRIMLANVHTSNRHFDLVAGQIGREKPDCLLLMEVNQEWLDELASTTDDFPHQTARPRDDNFGIAFYSRLPVESLEIQRLGDAELPSVVAKLQIGSEPVTVIGTHTLPPVGRVNALARNDQLRAVAELARETPGRVLVVGDLNLTPWSPYFSELLRTGDLRDGRRGFGIRPTWFMLRGLIRIPIDHLLVSPNMAVDDFRVGPHIGSDHRPLVVDLRVVP